MLKINGKIISVLAVIIISFVGAFFIVQFSNQKLNAFDFERQRLAMAVEDSPSGDCANNTTQTSCNNVRGCVWETATRTCREGSNPAPSSANTNPGSSGAVRRAASRAMQRMRSAMTGSPPPCIDNWTCGPWSACTRSDQPTAAGNETLGQRTRTCTNICSNSPATPPNLEACTLSPCTANDWSCSDYSACSQAGQQTRSCVLTNLNCLQPLAVLPASTQTCTPPPQTCAPSNLTVSAVGGWNQNSRDMVSFRVATGNCSLVLDSFEVETWVLTVEEFDRNGDFPVAFHGIDIDDPWGFVDNQRFAPNRGTACFVSNYSYTEGALPTIVSYNFIAETQNSPSNQIGPNSSKVITVRGGPTGGLKISRPTSVFLLSGRAPSLPIAFSLTKINGQSFSAPTRRDDNYTQSQLLVYASGAMCLPGTHGGHGGGGGSSSGGQSLGIYAPCTSDSQCASNRCGHDHARNPNSNICLP